MNILMISYNQTGHGTYLRAYEFAKGLVQLGKSVSLMSTAPQRRKGVKEWDENGIHIVETPALLGGPFRSGFDPGCVRARKRWLRNRQFDIVHAFESRPTVIYPALVLKNRGTPLVLDWCDWFGAGGSVEERPNPLLRTLLRPIETYYENHFRLNANATTVICSTLEQRAVMLGVDPTTLALIPNGYQMPGWEPQSKESAREHFGLKSTDFVVGYVGALFPRDARLMTQAFQRVRTDLPNAHLLHLGQSNYNPDDGRLDPRALTITGKIRETKLQKGLAACDVCWLPMTDIPANQGRSPLKASNYLTAGKPVVITDVGDLPGDIRSFGAGIVCEPTPESLAQAIITLAGDPNKCDAMAQAALKLSRLPEFSWQARAENLLSVYKLVTE